jgi:hypothetical protein
MKASLASVLVLFALAACSGETVEASPQAPAPAAAEHEGGCCGDDAKAGGCCADKEAAKAAEGAKEEQGGCCSGCAADAPAKKEQ